jgi:hypothetical protein
MLDGELNTQGLHMVGQAVNTAKYICIQAHSVPAPSADGVLQPGFAAAAGSALCNTVISHNTEFKTTGHGDIP